MKTLVSIRNLAPLLLIISLLTGCMPKIQVVTLRGSNVRPTEEGLLLDNDTLSLRYNFASERGLMHLTLTNKLNQPLYVDWKRSSFIIGDNKVDYWYDVAGVSLTGSSYQYSRVSRTSLSGTVSRDDKISFIPPKTKLEKSQFQVVPTGTVYLKGSPTTEQQEPHWASRRKPVDVQIYTYPADQSPLTFRNYITLSTDKDFQKEFHIDTQFWAADIKVLPREQVLTHRIVGLPGEYSTYSEPLPFKKADAFYVPIQSQ